MAASKLGARLLPLLAAAGLALISACYATTPHVAAVTSAPNARVDCAHTVAAVIESSGLTQLPTPPRWSMFFGARMTGPYTSFLRSGTGIGVNVSQPGGTAGTCHVTIEALSPDANCPEVHQPLVCGPGNNIWTNAIVGGQEGPAQPSGGGVPPAMHQPCPVVPPLGCDLSYAPGRDNDAVVDELARRVQAALGPGSRVN